MDEKGRWGDRLVYFLFGSVIGATVALLLAPSSGEETRELLATRVRESRDMLNEGVKTASDKFTKTRDKLETDARDMVTKGKSIVNKEKEVISAAIEAGKQAYKEEKEASKKKA